MAFTQYILSISNGGPIALDLNQRLESNGYELTRVPLSGLIGTGEDLQTIAENLEDAIVAQDVIYLTIEGGLLEYSESGYLITILKSLVKAALRNRVKKMIVCTSALSCLQLDYSFPAKTYYLLKASGIEFEMKHDPSPRVFASSNRRLLKPVADQLVAML